MYELSLVICNAYQGAGSFSLGASLFKKKRKINTND